MNLFNFSAFCLLCNFLASAGFADSDNVIWVHGKRRERYRKPHAGKSLLLKPAAPSRFSTQGHIKEDASLNSLETGKMSASGFSLPKIRGQDQHLTEVWVEDALVHDPWEGLPLASELDLLAFGELSMLQGVSPPGLMSLNPIGSLRYLVRNQGKDAHKLGFGVGKPYGLKVFARGLQHWQTKQMYGRSLLYGRTYQTDGKYQYYHDHGNPYDPDSGTYEQRANNDQRSWQFMPYNSLQMGPHQVKIIALSYGGQAGTPGYGGFLSLARQHSRGGFLSTHYSYALNAKTNPLLPSQLTLGAYLRDDIRGTSDPEHPITGLAIEERRKTKINRFQVGSIWEQGDFQLFSQLQFGKSELHASHNNDLIYAGIRNHMQGLLSSTLKPFIPFTIELKLLQRLQLDTFSSKKDSYETELEPPVLDLEQRMRAYSLASSLQIGPLRSYFQAAFYHRPPTIIEEFGDGNRVMPSLSLKPEAIKHYEAACDLALISRKLSLHIGAFADRTSNKISFVPALAYTYTAKNIEETLINGYEIATELTLRGSRLLASYTYLQPKILSEHLSDRVIPGLSHDQFVLALGQNLKPDWLLHLRCNYRSEAYRDLENSILVPMVVTYDASSDYQVKLSENFLLSMGLSVINLADMKTMGIASPYDPSRKGLVAYSDLDGYPLPGRQWIMNVHLDF